MLKQISIATIFAMATLMGCGEEVKEGNAKKDFDTIEDTDLSLIGKAVEGTGTIRYNTPLSSSSDNINININFRLNEAGAIVLKTHGDETLSNAVSLRFERKNEELFLNLGGEHVEDLEIDATGDIELSIDIHNSETPAHVIVWNGTSSANPKDAAFNSAEDHDHEHGHDEEGEHDDHDEEGDHDHEDHDADHEDDEDHDHEETVEIANGKGTFWGIQLINAKLIKAENGDALFHE